MNIPTDLLEEEELIDEVIIPSDVVVNATHSDDLLEIARKDSDAITAAIATQTERLRIRSVQEKPSTRSSQQFYQGHVIIHDESSESHLLDGEECESGSVETFDKSCGPDGLGTSDEDESSSVSSDEDDVYLEDEVSGFHEASMYQEDCVKPIVARRASEEHDIQTMNQTI